MQRSHCSAVQSWDGSGVVQRNVFHVLLASAGLREVSEAGTSIFAGLLPLERAAQNIDKCCCAVEAHTACTGTQCGSHQLRACKCASTRKAGVTRQYAYPVLHCARDGLMQFVCCSKLECSKRRARAVERNWCLAPAGFSPQLHALCCRLFLADLVVLLLLAERCRVDWIWWHARISRLVRANRSKRLVWERITYFAHNAQCCVQCCVQCCFTFVFTFVMVVLLFHFCTFHELHKVWQQLCDILVAITCKWETRGRRRKCFCWICMGPLHLFGFLAHVQYNHYLCLHSWSRSWSL